MNLLGRRITADLRFEVIFHIVLWTIWIGLPFVTAGDNEKHRAFMLALLPISLTNIPLFLMNSNWLVPKVFRRHGMPTYLASLIGLVVIYSVLQLFLKEWLVPHHLLRRRYDAFWAVVPVLFVTAISTGYAFIRLLLRQEQERQQEMEERLKSELAFLRSQISPHFIFNVLNSIVYLTRSNPSLAETVTIKLSELMRYMLYESNDALVPLTKEVEYLRNYVELQKIRFEEDVEIRLQTHGDIGGQLIEPMLMVPFVENAFKHGVGMVHQPIIDIDLKVQGKNVTFTVKNKTINEASEDKDNASGIGLRNVQRRLQLLYPETHELRFGEEGEWFVVYMSLKIN